jgi:hypothetical protein
MTGVLPFTSSNVEPRIILSYSGRTLWGNAIGCKAVSSKCHGLITLSTPHVETRLPVFAIAI